MAANAGATGPPAPVVITGEAQGRTVQLKVGQRLILKLGNPATGGYTTKPPVFNEQILTLKSQKKVPPTSGLAGDFGTLVYEWEALAPGRTEVAITIYRSWEKTAPEHFFRVNVEVSP